MNEMFNADTYRKILEDQVRILAYGGDIEDSLHYEQYCGLTELELEVMDATVAPALVATRDTLILDQRVNQNG